MRIRTFVLIAAVLAMIYAVTAVLLENDALLDQDFELLGGSRLPVKWMLFLAFAVGVGVTILVVGMREWGLLLDRWRRRRADRRSEEIEEDYSRGLVAVLEGREDEALRHFRAVIERDSRHFNTLINIGDLLRGQRNYTEAIEFHRKAHHLKPDNTRPLYALVEDHEAQGDLVRARNVLGKIIGINKTSDAAWRKLRSLHMKEREWDKALEANDKVVKLSPAPQDADRRCGLGIRYEIACSRIAAGKPREALAGFRKLLKEDDSFIPAHVGLGKALRDAGQESDALSAWHTGFELTGSPIFLTLLEDHHLQREQPLAAIEALKRCISGARKDTVPRFYLGKLYFRLEMLDDAQSVLSSLEGRASYAPTLHYLLGRIHERRENHAEAALEYRKVIKEMELVQLAYECRACGEQVMDWTPRCSGCEEWNSVEVAFREELPPEELGLAPAPIYTARS